MDDQLRTDVRELAGITMAHSNLLVTLMGLLKARGLISQDDINEVVDLALFAAENSEPMRPDIREETRAVLEDFGRTVGGKPPAP